MTTSVQRRRGTTAQHSTFTGLEGEITIDTTKDTAVIHDGATVGGYPLVKESLSNANPTPLTALSGAGTAADDVFLVYDTSTSTQKKITRAELKNAIELETFTNITISGGSINGTAIGSSTASTGNFTALYIGGAQITSSVAELNLLDGVTATTTELNYVDGVTSNIQTQLDAKAPLSSPTFTGTLATAGLNVTDNSILGNSSADTLQINATPTLAVAPTLSYATANRVPYINADKLLTSSANFTYDGASLGLAGQLNLTNASNYNLYASGAGANYLAGSLGIGAVPTAGYSLQISKNITGSVNSAGVRNFGIVQSDVTASFYNFDSVSSTAAASFTLAAFRHYSAQQSTIGAGSAITTQIGYFSGVSLTGATNNYGFQGTIASATGAWNLYMSGTANNYMAGSLGIGTTSLTDRTLAVASNITGATSAYGIVSNGQVQSGVTTSAYGVYSGPTTAAAAFTLTNLYNYFAVNTTIGGTSAVTNFFGYATGALSGATNNYGFYGNLAAATGRYNLYMAGTADNYLAGSLGIGAVPAAGTTVTIAKNLTGSTGVTGVWISATVQSDATTNAFGFRTNIATAAAAFTLPDLVHFYANQSTIGATSAVTNQYGLLSASTLTGATNNYAFYGQIAAATGRYNLYMGGTADNYLAGSLGVGSVPNSAGKLTLGGTLPAVTNAYAYMNLSTAGASTTGLVAGYLSQQNTAASLALGSIRHFQANQGSFGASSTVTNQNGFYADSSLTGATNNYGFYGNIAAATGRYNLYMAGSADNYLAGKLGIGTTTMSQQLNVTAVNTTGFAGQRITNNNANVGIAGVEFASDSTYAKAAIGLVRNSPNGVGVLSFYNSASTGAADWTTTDVAMTIVPSGNIGLGSNGVGYAGIFSNKNITGGAFSAGYYTTAPIQSDVTTAGRYFATGAATAAASFTCANLNHFYGSQGTFGAGSTVTVQSVFKAELNCVGATNNYAFEGSIPAATGRYNLYMTGTADNYLAGRLGIGSTALTTTNLRVQQSMTGGTVVEGIYSAGAIQSDVTSQARYFRTYGNTAATSFTLSTLYHYSAEQGTIGAGSAITSQIGYNVSGNLSGATNNYSFYGSIAAATGAWNLYMSGTANNYMAGSLGIGSTSLTGINLYVGKTITGATSSFGIAHSASVQSDVTSNAYGMNMSVSTAAAAFTLTNLYLTRTTFGGLGAGSAVTNMYGYYAESTITGATNNYGFYGNIAAATGRYNLYMGGTADNYLAGNTGIGGLPKTSLSILSGTATGQTIGTGCRFLIDGDNGNNWIDIFASTIGAMGIRFGDSGSAQQGRISYQNNGDYLDFWTNGAERLRITSAGQVLQAGLTAIPAGGTAGLGYAFSSTANFGVFFGSGAPTLSAAKGSLYLRSDGSATNNRMYVNTDGGTTWTAVTTAA